MNSIKKYLESIRQYPFPKTRALEQELDAVRKAHAAVSEDLGKVRENLQRDHEDDVQRLVDLQQQVGQIESERSNARERVEYLEGMLAAAEQRLKSMETDVGSLGVELEEERNKARMQIEYLEGALAGAGQRQKSIETDVSLLGAKLEEERSNTRKQVEHMEHALGDAQQRQKSTEVHLGSLEAMLEEERKSHDAGIHAMETFLARMQSEQKSHLKLQSELADSLREAAMRLQGTPHLRGDKPQLSLLKLLTMAVVLFVTGALAGVFALQSRQDENRKLAVMEGDISDMRQFMKQHIDNQDVVLKDIALVLNRQTSAAQAIIAEQPTVHEAETQGVEEQPQNTVAFEPDIRELQASLIALGFDLGMSKPNGDPGIKTRQALQEFRQFYLPPDDAQDGVVNEPLAALILKSADLVRVDAAHFNISSDVLAAIRLGSIRTGVDFSFLMELARVESNFNPTVRAPRSSATGLFQFKDLSWLEAMRTFGADYGLQDYATRVKPVNDEEYEQQPIVRDPLQLEVLALRLNPRLSTLMAAENIKRNLQTLSGRIGHEPGRTELYLAHYLGPNGSLEFLKTLDEAPATIAAELFPEEATSDPGVFQGWQGQPRTVAEVYQWLDRKFNTARYDDPSPG